MKYLYESHLGGIYVTNKKLSADKLHCSSCGDSDWLIGGFETIKGFWSLIKDQCDIKGSGGIALQYIYPLMVETFKLPDVVEYEDECDKHYGLCSHSDKEILARIKELIKENIGKRQI